jgi:hypothetical protein
VSVACDPEVFVVSGPVGVVPCRNRQEGHSGNTITTSSSSMSSVLVPKTRSVSSMGSSFTGTVSLSGSL